MATGTAEPGIVRGRRWADTLARPTRDWLGDLRRTTPALSLMVLALLVILPLLVMLIASFRPAGTFPLDPGPLVLSNFADAYFTPNTLVMLGNTAVFASVPLLFAVPMAFRPAPGLWPCVSHPTRRSAAARVHLLGDVRADERADLRQRDELVSAARPTGWDAQHVDSDPVRPGHARRPLQHPHPAGHGVRARARHRAVDLAHFDQRAAQHGPGPRGSGRGLGRQSLAHDVGGDRAADDARHPGDAHPVYRGRPRVAGNTAGARHASWHRGAIDARIRPAPPADRRRIRVRPAGCRWPARVGGGPGWHQPVHAPDAARLALRGGERQGVSTSCDQIGPLEIRGARRDWRLSEIGRA